jgi:hypothetical protein
MKVEAWLVLKAKSGYGTYPPSSPYAGQTRINGARVVKVAVNKPTLADDEITFKIEIDVDESWFLEGTATIKATVPAQPASSSDIQATVDMPVRGRAQSPAAAVVRHP